jgi:hypothetical protein
MTLIQPLLILLIVLAVVIYISRLRSRFRDRCIVLGITIAGIVLIAAPGLSTTIAHSVGVGRGVDLVIYLSLVGLAFSNLFLFSKLRSVEGQITSIVRELGIRGAMSELDTSAEMPGGPFRTEGVPPGPAPSL